jgi:hypothetical protein
MAQPRVKEELLTSSWASLLDLADKAYDAHQQATGRPEKSDDEACT